MRIILPLFLVLFFNITYSQSLPTDGEILQNIFGSDQVKFRIVFKAFTTLEDKRLLFAVTNTWVGYAQGHSFAFENFYFLEKQNLNYILIDSVVEEEASPRHDKEEYSLVDVGKQRKALVITSQDKMNDHLEIYKELYALEPGDVRRVGGFDIPRRNKAFKIIKSNKKWYDIHVRGLKTSGKKQRDSIYVYVGNEYVEKITP